MSFVSTIVGTAHLWMRRWRWFFPATASLFG
jgi:hypothetical protein